MTEDEEFEILEARIAAQERAKIVEEYMHRAVLEAQRFVENNQADLGIFTLRKAFEVGYRLGWAHAKEER